MENTEQKQLCKNCQQFYGTSDKEYLCTKCYKEKNNIKDEPLKLQKSVRVLCSDCQSFYSTAETENLCSTCYKRKYPQAQQQKQSQPILNKDEEEKHQLETSCQQNDHKKCWTCKKNVGYNGFKCKCAYTFCGRHRMAEDHECTYDFKKKGIELLEKNNPQVKGLKIEKIISETEKNDNK